MNIRRSSDGAQRNPGICAGSRILDSGAARLHPGYELAIISAVGGNHPFSTGSQPGEHSAGIDRGSAVLLSGLIVLPATAESIGKTSTRAADVAQVKRFQLVERPAGVVRRFRGWHRSRAPDTQVAVGCGGGFLLRPRRIPGRITPARDTRRCARLLKSEVKPRKRVKQ